jgi:hypothetical protein
MALSLASEWLNESARAPAIRDKLVEPELFIAPRRRLARLLQKLRTTPTVGLLPASERLRQPARAPALRVCFR